MSEHHKRSIAKTLSWRFFATLTTIGLVYLFTGSWAASAGVGLLEVFAKLMLYYGHERVWNTVTWGKKKK